MEAPGTLVLKDQVETAKPPAELRKDRGSAVLFTSQVYILDK